MNVVVVEGADAGSIPTERFRSEVKALPDCSRLEIHVSIAAVAKRLRGAGEVCNHRNGEARISRQRLLQAQKSGDALDVRAVKLLQSSLQRIPAIDAGLAIADTVNVEIERNEVRARGRRLGPSVEIGTPIRGPIARRKIQELLQLTA